MYLNYSIYEKGKFNSIFFLKRELNVKNTSVVYPEGDIYYNHNQVRLQSAEYIPVQAVNVISKDGGVYIRVEVTIEEDGSMDNFIQIR